VHAEAQNNYTSFDHPSISMISPMHDNAKSVRSPASSKKTNKDKVRRAKRVEVVPKLWLANIANIVLCAHLIWGVILSDDFHIYAPAAFVVGFMIELLTQLLVLPFRNMCNCLRKYRSNSELSNVFIFSHCYWFVTVLIVLITSVSKRLDITDEKKGHEMGEKVMNFAQVIPILQMLHFFSFTSLIYSPDIIADFFIDYAPTLELLERTLAPALIVNHALVHGSLAFICIAMLVHTGFCAFVLNEKYQHGTGNEVLETSWTIVGILLQDLPFFIIRIVIWAEYEVVNIYFVIKNAVFLALNIWRVVRTFHHYTKKNQETKPLIGVV